MQAAFASRFAVLALALTTWTSAGAGELHGTVVAVGDGDTLTVLDAAQRRHKVRLAAIDAPERRQPYGEHAKQHLLRLVRGKSVLVDWMKRDRYGRIVGRVLLAECAHAHCSFAQDAALEQLKAGLAWHYTRYASEQPPGERLQYAGTEREARARRDGLWADAHPVPPWLFRSRHLATLGSLSARRDPEGRRSPTARASPPTNRGKPSTVSLRNLPSPNNRAD